MELFNNEQIFHVKFNYIMQTMHPCYQIRKIFICEKIVQQCVTPETKLKSKTRETLKRHERHKRKKGLFFSFSERKIVSRKCPEKGRRK